MEETLVLTSRGVLFYSIERLLGMLLKGLSQELMFDWHIQQKLVRDNTLTLSLVTRNVSQEVKHYRSVNY